MVFLVDWMDGGLIEACTWLALLLGCVIHQLLRSKRPDVKWKYLSWTSGRCTKDLTLSGNSAGSDKKPQTPSKSNWVSFTGQIWCLADDSADKGDHAQIASKLCDGPQAAEHQQEHHYSRDNTPSEAVKAPLPQWLPLPRGPMLDAGCKLVSEVAARLAVQQVRTDQQQLKALSEAANTQRIRGIPGHVQASMLRQRLDLHGLKGAYDWFWMPVDPDTKLSKGEAFINLVHPFFVAMLQTALAEPPCWGEVQTAEGAAAPPPMTVAKQILKQRSSEAPQVTEVTATQEPLDHLHKTKLCVFYAKGRCNRGTACSFAHSHAELQAPPDFFKTSFCYNFRRRQCNDANCKYAHGVEEIRNRKIMDIPEQIASFA